jgi:hypothetical protein
LTGGMRMMLFALLLGCNQYDSHADDVNRPGLWHATFQYLDGADLQGNRPPDYPPRDLTAPVIDACTAGCDCAWVGASNECSGDIAQTCKAIGGFIETCSKTIFDCSRLSFDSDTHAADVCVLEDSTQMNDFGYVQLGRYWMTLDRVHY